MRLSFIFFLTLFCSLSARSETFYVSGSGDNSHNGSQPEPWQTLQYAADHTGPGDTVIVQSGDYSGFYTDVSGTADDPIVFKATEGAVITTKNQTTDDAINLEGASYVVIDGFTITNDHGTIERAGIRSVVNTGAVIRNNTITGMGTWGIFTGFSESVTIENNSCSFSVDEHGIYHSNSADNPVIRGNICFSNHGNGIHMNGDISMGGDGIISNATIAANIIYDNGRGGGSGINCDGVQNSVIKNNLLYNNHASGISLYKIDGAEGSTGNTVVNNTIVMPSDGRWAININSGSTENTIRNNILFSYHSFRGGLSLDESSFPGTVSDYNVMVDRLSPDWGDTGMTLSEWQSEFGLDLHSIVSAPGQNFRDPENNDYHLLENADARDNGTGESAPLYDLDGYPRPEGEDYDAGAYEYRHITGTEIPADAKRKMFLFPNPAIDRFTVKAERDIDKIEIISTEGKIIRSIQVDHHKSAEIPVSGIEKGLVFIRVHAGNEIYVSHLLVL
ncbi:MAG: right-handed parallel beta-helix repeat-containing protein [Bacteroidales bacterium]|jgi:parallel beta-helix repeat protein